MDITCPHCEEDITLEECAECGEVVVETSDGEEVCEECHDLFCEEHIDEHGCGNEEEG